MQNLLKDLWQDFLGNLDFSYEKNIFNHELAALILCANEQNYKELLSLENYKKHLKITNFFDLKMLQVAVLNSLKSNFLDPLEIIFYLEKLKILNPKSSVFSYLENVEISHKKELKNDFENEKNALKESYEKLSKLLSKELKTRLDELFLQLMNKDFKIAFSGIFNAGKSSLINALLDKEILGVSNAPETANLSFIKYAENESVKVSFYAEDEFMAIKKQACINDELAAIFNIDYERYEDCEISLDKLSDFTSSSSKISIFVKYISINLNNDYLKNKINIVDTPGLDDVVISREQLSKEFLKQANCVLYLMSCTQALSIKDLEFLCNFVKNNPNSKLVLVLTKSDLIRQSEQIKLKEYVKIRFENELKNLDITPNYELFCLSTNEYKKDSSKGGITAFRAYLNDLCFNSTSTNEFINSIKEKFKNLIDLEINSLKTINNSLKIDKNQHQQELCRLQKDREERLKNKNLLENKLNDYLKITYDINLYELKVLAKNQASKIKDEFNYDKKYSQETAKKSIFQGFKDVLNAEFSRLSRDFIKDFDEIKNTLKIQKKLQISFDKLKLSEIFDEFLKILTNLKISEDENLIKGQLEGIYLNLNLEFFKLKEEKSLTNEFLKSEFLSIYHLNEISLNEFKDENSLKFNEEKIQKLLSLKEGLQ